MKHDGAFCVHCFFFAELEAEKGKNVKSNTLVNAPYNRWKEAKEVFNRHQTLDYHKNASVSALNFIDVKEKKIVGIDVHLDRQRYADIERNRKMLASIVNTIILIGRQGIAARGHRDSGPMSLDTPTENDGNFRALLRYSIASGNDILKKHIDETRNRYTSPKIQNELIEICGRLT